MPPELWRYKPKQKIREPKYAQRYLELATAKAWNLMPSTWDGLSVKDKAQMMAFDIVETKIKLFVDEQIEAKYQDELNKKDMGTPPGRQSRVRRGRQ